MLKVAGHSMRVLLAKGIDLGIFENNQYIDRWDTKESVDNFYLIQDQLDNNNYYTKSDNLEYVS